MLENRLKYHAWNNKLRLADSKRETKRKVDLLSSHSENDNENGPVAASYSPLASDLGKLDNCILEALRYIHKPVGKLVYKEIQISVVY